MKIGIVLPGNIWFAPYILNYTKILDTHGIQYEFISWDRTNTGKESGYQFHCPLNSKSIIGKFLPYLKYSIFVKRIIKQEKFDKLILGGGPQIATLILPFLIRKYRYKFILDYRDLSIEQYPLFRQLFSIIIKNSYANVISSPGFKEFIPKGDYLISHNFDIDVVERALQSPIEVPAKKNNEISILTIGGIRDYAANVEVVDSIKDDKNVTLYFVGRGVASEPLKNYVEKHNIKNVIVKGFYKKEEEKQYVKTCDFINIYYPKIPSHSSALSNRFYNSLVYKKPMIVTNGGIQGWYATEYNIGISVDTCENLVQKLRDWRLNNIEKDYIEYCHRCNSLLQLFKSDYLELKNSIESFIQ